MPSLSCTYVTTPPAPPTRTPTAEAQSGAPFLADWLRAGIRHYRVELVDERAADVAPLLEHYRALGDALWAAPDRGYVHDADKSRRAACPCPCDWRFSFFSMAHRQ